MQGNTEVRKRLGVSVRTADGLLQALLELRSEADTHWEALSQRISEIGQVVCSTDYSRRLPEDWREQVVAFSKIRVQRAFAYLAELTFRTELAQLHNFREWRALVKQMNDAVVQERAFTRRCEDWIEQQKAWRSQNEQR